MKQKKTDCNLIVSHHPIVFFRVKKIHRKKLCTEDSYKSTKNDIAIYAIHTNLDNVLNGVNGRIAELLGLNNISVLAPKENQLKKLFTFIPTTHADKVRQAIFDAAGGHIGIMRNAVLIWRALGTFKGGLNTDPFVGKPGKLHIENEIKVEVIFPGWARRSYSKKFVGCASL
jgi:hypothetical protein